MRGKIGLIYACDQRGGIGINNRLPWRCPADMAHFWRVIGNTPVIVGAQTWSGIGKYFARRNHPRAYVLSKTNGYSYDALISHLDKTGESCWVIGGAKTYGMFIDVADIAIRTVVSKTYDCDIYMPWGIDAPPKMFKVNEVVLRDEVDKQISDITFTLYVNSKNTNSVFFDEAINMLGIRYNGKANWV